MKISTSILATTIALFGMSIADDAPIVTILVPDAEGETENFRFEGSVVEAGPSATTMVVGCDEKAVAASPSLYDPPFCSMWESATVIAGPSTYRVAVRIADDETTYTQHMGCNIHQSSSQAVCSATAVLDTTTTATEYHSVPDETRTLPGLSDIHVTITAGADKLSATQTASGAETTGAEPTGTETGAAPRITGAAHWAVGGMAAVALAAAA